MKNKAKCLVKEGKLFIDKDFEEVIVQIFNSNGTLFRQLAPGESSEAVTLPGKGFYLVVIQAVNQVFVHKVECD